MSLTLNNREAFRMFSKIKADIKEGSNHQIVRLTIEGKQIFRTLISRSSKDSFPTGTVHSIFRDLGFAGAKQDAIRLRDCPMSNEEYVQHLRKQGML